MSAQVLSARSTRRIGRATGLAITRAWGRGGYVFFFATPEHRHGWYDSKTGAWGYDEDAAHYTSCDELFPDAPASPEPPAP